MSKLTIDALAQEIRRVDGNHSLGASALAEALMPLIAAHLASQAEWPSDAELELIADAYDAGSWNDEFIGSFPAMRAALHSVCPPVGVASDDRAALLYLMQQFDSETWECPNCGHSEDTATMDSAYYLREYLASSIERKAPDDAMTPIKALQAICDAHKFNIASLPPHQVHEIAQSAITRHLSQPAERGEAQEKAGPVSEDKFTHAEAETIMRSAVGKGIVVENTNMVWKVISADYQTEGVMSFSVPSAVCQLESVFGISKRTLVISLAELQKAFPLYVDYDTAPPAERVRVPDGWRLVPIKPTEEMFRAANEAAGDLYLEWSAMLSAAPEASSHD
jgi:hypothetical protein